MRGIVGACRSLFASSLSFQFDFFAAHGAPASEAGRKCGIWGIMWVGQRWAVSFSRHGLCQSDDQARPGQAARPGDCRSAAVATKAPAGANAGEFQVSIDTTATVEELKEKAGCMATERRLETYLFAGHARFPHKSTSQRRTFGWCASAASGRPGITTPQGRRGPQGCSMLLHRAGHPDRRVLRAERRSRGALSEQSAWPSEMSSLRPAPSPLLTRDGMLALRDAGGPHLQNAPSCRGKGKPPQSPASRWPGASVPIPPRHPSNGFQGQTTDPAQAPANPMAQMMGAAPTPQANSGAAAAICR